MVGTVTLVGAGCGKVGWLTLDGAEALASCTALVYDALIDPALLDLAPQDAKKIPVGKRAGKHSETQEDINGLLVSLAHEGHTVVRLKGGDPYLFGRGGEEALALSQAGVPYTVLPGIPSALAIPLEAGIPVTHRGVSRGVHIVTAHTDRDTLPENLSSLAMLPGTLVFLMGLSHLRPLVRTLLASGKAPSTPAAVLSGGNSPTPARVVGTLEDIVEKVSQEGVQAPAVILVGEAASLDLRSPGPLTGCRVGLTGTEEFRAKLRSMLVPLGAEVRTIQGAHCSPLSPSLPWDSLTDGRSRWLLFTSPRGVAFFFRLVREHGVDFRAFARCRFGVIGKETGKALRRHGFTPDLCPEEFTSHALAEALLHAVSSEEEVWLLQAENGSDAVQKALGDQCVSFPLYATHHDPVVPGKAPRYLLFGSAGGVKALAETGCVLPPETTPLCIGPVAAQACQERFSRSPLVPETSTAEAMVALLKQDAGR